MHETLQQCLANLMRELEQARPRDAFRMDHPVGALFDEVAQLITQHVEASARDHLQLQWSMGRGAQWASVPWLALWDERVSPRGRAGAHVAYLLCEDMRGLYLAYLHGDQALVQEHGPRKGRKILSQRVEVLRQQARAAAPQGFAFEGELMLREDKRGRRASPGEVIAYKRYALDALPEDRALLRDLDELLDVYEAHAQGTSRAPVRAWLVSSLTSTWPAQEVAPRAGEVALVWEDDAVVARAQIDEVTSQGRKLTVSLTDREDWPERVMRDEIEAFEPLRGLSLPTSKQKIVALSVAQEQAFGALRRRALERFDLGEAVVALHGAILARGYLFEPWQIAAYVTALRTKPLVILAGISGTGKSRLPALVAELTGGWSQLVPVRPDWSDSAEVLGFVDLQGRFQPGHVLRVARRASQQPERHAVCVLDEMNLARVEQYFAELLSQIEAREPAPGGGWHTAPLLQSPLGLADRDWAEVRMPPNLAIVGTVNMDESTHGFSRKVLDRAFTLEISEVDLSQWETRAERAPAPPRRWPLSAWTPLATRAGELPALSAAQRSSAARVVEALQQINRSLQPVQLQVGYRVRDELILFVLHAREVASAMRQADGAAVDALDLGIMMKVLPRLTGAHALLRRALLGLLGWAVSGAALDDDARAAELVEAWEEAGAPWALADAAMPRTAARLCLMWQRLAIDGYTSYWLS